MTDPPIAAQIHQTFNVGRHFAAKIPFDLVFPVDNLAEADDLAFR
jgi:hypothetical protein